MVVRTDPDNVGICSGPISITRIGNNATGRAADEAVCLTNLQANGSKPNTALSVSAVNHRCGEWMSSAPCGV
jgi:hypothetical protein